MRELNKNAFSDSRLGRLAKGLKRHSQKLRSIAAAFALMFAVGSVVAQSTYTKVTEAPEDWSGEYLIVAGTSALAGGTSGWGTIETVAVDGNTIVTSSNISVTIAKRGESNTKYTVFMNSNSKYLKEVTSNTFATADDASSDTEWVISVNASGEATIACESAQTRHLRCNGTSGYRCYTSATGSIPSLYKKQTGETPTVATPTFSPVAGSYNVAQNVTIACATEGATIRYTIDGTEPTETSTEYTAAIEVAASMTIKAKAWKTDMEASAVATAEYVINIVNPYTVTLVAGTGAVETATLAETAANSGVILPTPTISCGDYSFYGWATAEVATGTTSAPVVVNAGEYHPEDNITLYAVYKKAISDEPVRDTLKYGNWNVTGATDKTSYSLLVSNAYILSGAYDLSIITGISAKIRTFGGSSYNNLTVVTSSGVTVGTATAAGSSLAYQNVTLAEGLNGVDHLKFYSANASTSNGLGVSEIVITLSEERVYATNPTDCEADPVHPTMVVSPLATYPANTPVQAVVTINSDGATDMLCGASYVVKKDGVPIESIADYGTLSYSVRLAENTTIERDITTGTGNIALTVSFDEQEYPIGAFTLGIFDTYCVERNRPITFNANFNQLGVYTIEMNLLSCANSTETDPIALAQAEIPQNEWMLSMGTTFTSTCDNQEHTDYIAEICKTPTVIDTKTFDITLVPATPVFSVAAGEQDAPISLEITCATPEAAIYYTTDGTEPTAESTLYSTALAISENTTVKAIAVKNSLTSAVAEAVYTFPVFLENLAAVYATENNAQYKMRGDVTFVYRNGRYVYVQDATAGMLIYDNAQSVITNEYNEGDVISGGIMGKTSIFRGLYEMVPQANTAVSTVNNGPVAPAALTSIRQMVNGNEYTSRLVSFRNMTITAIDGQNITVSDGDTTTVVRDTWNVVTEGDFAINDRVNVTGFASIYNTFQIVPRTAADFAKVEVIAAPTFTPEAGIYTGSVDVTIACATEGAIITYTLNDTDAQNTYSAPLHITETTTIYAKAVKGDLESEAVSATYTITNLEIVATPTFSIANGTYETAQNVTIACETEGAEIRYTIDGTEPTAESTLYENAIELAANGTYTIKAKAFKEEMLGSEIAVLNVTISLPIVAELPFAWTSNFNTTPNGVTNNGVGNYSSNSLKFDGTGDNIIIRYNGVADSLRFTIGANNNFTGATIGAAANNENAIAGLDTLAFSVKAYAGETETILRNFVSTDAMGEYVLALAADVNKVVFNYDKKSYGMNIAMKNINITKATVAAPTFTPEAGIYTNSVNVAIACATEGATIYYTLNDAETQNTYAEPLTFTETTTVHAKAVKGEMESEVVSATYTITDMEIVATPTITPNGGNFETTQEVTLACETAEANIYYTLNGDEPTAESTLYTAAFTLEATTTVKAIAVKEGMINSAVAEATFTKAEPIVAVEYTRITSLSQLQDGDKVVIASRYDDDATHYYVAPTSYRNITSSNQKIVATLADATSISEDYVITSDADTIVWTLKVVGNGYMFVNAANDTLGWISGSTNFSYTSNKVWAIAEYTAEAGSLMATYTGYKLTNAADDNRSLAFRNNDDKWYGVYAFSSNKANSQYNFALDIFADLGEHAPLVATPTFSVPAGNYTSVQNVEIACATEGATIRYTLDGSDPTETSTEYVAAIEITEPTTVKAKAFKADYIASAIATAYYNVVTTPTIIVDVETLNFTIQNETKTVNVSSLNLTEDITVAVTENFTVSTETIAMNTEATLNVVFTGTTHVNGTLTLTSGETVKTIALVATPLVASEGCYYPVVDAQEDWSGDYLITYSDLTAEKINALNGVSDANIGTYTSVYQYYADGVIASNLSTEVCKVTVAATAEGAYSMYMYGNGYLGLNSDANKFYANETFTDLRDEWTFSVNNDGNVVITSKKYPERQLQWNASSPRFACYTGSQTAVTLYKLGAIPAVATPVFTPAAGYYEEAQNVTITCSTEGASIYYTTDGTNPTSASTQYTGAIAVSTNTTIKAIAVLGEDNSFVATARYTFPTFVENIAALYAIVNPNGTYKLTGDVTFVYRNDRNMYVKDATAGLLIYDQNNKITTEYVEGDVISGGISGTISNYHGLLEYVPVLNTAASTQNTGAVAPIVVTVEQLNTNNYVSQLVTVEGVTVATGATYTAGNTGDNITFSQNGNDAIMRNNFKTLDMTIADNSNLNITGFAAINNENTQIYPRNNEDISVITSVEELSAEVSIYPNPTTDILNINLNGMNAQRVELVNVNGQVVMTEAINGDNAVVSLASQPTGMYFVRIYTDSEVIVSKVTKF